MTDQDFFYYKHEALELMKKYISKIEGGRGYGRRSDFSVTREISLDDIDSRLIRDPIPPNYSILSDYMIYDITSYDELLEVSGLFKQYFSNKGLQILWRGQTSDHKYKQLPSLIRFFQNDWTGIHDQAFQTHQNYIHRLIEILGTKLFDEGLIDNYLVLEPLLQHYGFLTKWIDLLDNINIAARFCLPYDLTDLPSEIESNNFSYIFIYGVKGNFKLDKGIWEGENQRLVNLRESISHLSVRPHIQQGYSLIDKRLYSIGFSKTIDRTELAFTSSYSKYVLCCLRLKKSDIMDWLGIQGDLPTIFKSDYLLTKSDLIYSKIMESVIIIFENAFPNTNTKASQKQLIKSALFDFNVLFTKSKVTNLLEFIDDQGLDDLGFDIDLFKEEFDKHKDDLF